MKSLLERVVEAAPEFSAKKRGSERQQLPGYWRASSMGACARQQAYDFKGLKSEWETSPEKTMSLEDGHVHEEEIITRIVALPDVEELARNRRILTQFKRKDGVVIKLAGRPDLEIVDHGEHIVVEIKALQNSAFEEISRTGIPPQKYVTQLQVYMLLLRRKKGILYIKNRNTSAVLSFDVECTDEDRREILRRQFKIQKTVDDGALPEREYTLGSPECFYCPHNKRCWPQSKTKGYIHKRGDEKGVTVDLSEEKTKSRFLTSAKTFERAKRKIEILQGVQDDARKSLERLMRRYKADGIGAEGYSAKRVFSRSERPDPRAIKKLVKQGALPMVESSSSYVRVDLPRTKKGKSHENVQDHKSPR